MDVIQKVDQGTVTEMPKVRRRCKEKMAKIIEDADAVKGDNSLAKGDGDNKKVKKAQLKKKMAELSEVNENLNKAISAKNLEISDLKKSVQSLNEVINSVPIEELRCSSSIARSNLLELSKNNSQLRTELEITKNRVNKKAMQIKKLEGELKQAQQAGNSKVTATQDSSDELRSKLNAIQLKLFETRNKNTELQSQLKLSLKCLQREIGEHFNFAALATRPQNFNWRGRAQQIVHLQQKVQELKARLEMLNRNSIGGRPIPFESRHFSQTELIRTQNGEIFDGHEVANIPPNMSATSFNHYNTVVRKTETLHRAKVESLENEIASLKGQLEEQRGKVLALKVRNKTLNDEVLRYKTKAAALEEQADYNGFNLTNMNEKMNVQRFHYENRLEETGRQMKDLKSILNEVEFRKEELRLKLENMENLLESKDSRIEELNQTILRLETDLKALSGGFLFSCRELRKEEFIAILDSIETEKNELLKYHKMLIARSKEYSDQNEALNDQVAKQKVRISRLETRIRELDMEIEQQTERKKRTQRIAEYVNSMSSLSPMGSFVFENSTQLGNLLLNTQIDVEQVLRLKHELEYTKEKLTYLTEKVTHLQEEKDNDARAFFDIINNSKNIVLETILGNRSNASLSLEINTG